MIRRFLAVTVVVTATDVGVLALGRANDVPVAPADAIAVVVASALSWFLHRTFTLADDPFVRWVRQPGAFLATAALAGTVDVAWTWGLATSWPLAGSKTVALVLAGVVRFTAYRAILLTDTRRELETRRPRPLPPGDHRLSVVLPAYEEAGRVADSVARVRAALADVDAEIVVVDDGSPDDTAGAAAATGARVIRLESNQGKGAAVRAGMLAATGRTVAFTDIDLAYDPAQLRTLLAAVEDGWDVAVGNRWDPASRAVARPSFVRQLSSRLFNLLTATVLLGQYRDTQCGCKAFRRDVATELFSRARLDGFAFDVEVLHLVERYRYSLTEVPVTVDDSGTSTIRVAAVAIGMVRDLFRVRRWGTQGHYDRSPTGARASDG